ncbi:MAG TPA: Xaa-Pro peptidase family protein [Thermomicrobiales bacterium]|nr:Xaa-Pro peptidase family protein [Thermomicrobiales bacterium]
MSLSENEYLTRRRAIFDKTAGKHVDAFVLFGPNNVSYFSRFGFVATERPIAYLLTPQRSILLLPRLEVEHGEQVGLIDEVIPYPEYPGLRRPLEFLQAKMVELGLGNRTIGVDADGYGRLYGYRGPKLSELLPEAKIVDVMDEIEHMQMLNSAEELDLLREACKWGDVAHRYLQDLSEVGVSEIEIAQKATMAASQEMLRTLGPEFRPRSIFGSVASAGFRGQVGVASANPHALSNNALLQPGDCLVTGAAASVFGYSGELERSMVVREPSAEQERYFNLMLAAQTLAIETIRPGIPCSAVDDAVNQFFAENGLQETWRHHTGHAKSTLIHEAPFLDRGDHRMIEVGMVFTVEPGIYVEGLGGFRHSDTVAVTETGVEWLTDYPRDLASLIVG